MACYPCCCSSSTSGQNTVSVIVSDTSGASYPLSRVSLLFRDAPTDADYAMELITKRIATGQDVDVASLKDHSRRTSNASTSTDNLSLTSSNTWRGIQSSEDDKINWKKWSERVARGKLLVKEGRRFVSTRVRSLQTITHA